MSKYQASTVNPQLKKGYKQTKVGVIPEDWEVKMLGEIGSFKKGKGIKKEAVLPDGLPCIRYGEIYTCHAEYIKGFNSFISIEIAKESHRIKQGDLLFAGSGETAEEIGKCVAYLENKEAYAGGDIIILSPFKCDSKYLGFLLNNKVIAKQKSQMAQGDAIVHIYSTNLKKILLSLPPTKAEQTTIANVLSDTDALITSLEKLIAKKQNIKQGAMQELLTGKKRLPGFSGEWEAKTIGDIIIDCFSGATPRRNCPDFYKGDILWITSGELNYDVIIDTSEKISKVAMIKTNLKLLPKNTFLMAITGLEAEGTRGSCGIVGKEATTNQSCMAIFLAEECLVEYLFHYYVYRGKSLALQYCQGTKQQSYTAKVVKLLPIILPPVTEQTAIAKILSDIDSEIEQLKQKLNKYKMIKRGMMQELLTGKTRLV